MSNILSAHCPTCTAKDETIRRLRWNDELGMLNNAGLMDAIRGLPRGNYAVVFADIDRLKTLNTATGSHFATNRYLADGLRVRQGEIAGQLFGDEIVFILNEQSRGEDAQPAAFTRRIARQLAGQPLRSSERWMLAAAQGCSFDQARLSATFASASGVQASAVLATIEQLSIDVLALKAARDRGMTG